MGARWPSVDELASALRRAAGLPPGAPSDTPPWPVLGLEATARALLERVRSMTAGGGIALEGPRGAGRSTLVRRLAWTLGVDGSAVAVIEAPKGGMPIGEVVELELAQPASNGASGGEPRADHAPIVIVDDAEQIDEAGRARAAKGLGGRRAARGRRPAQRGREDGLRRAGGVRRARRSRRTRPTSWSGAPCPRCPRRFARTSSSARAARPGRAASRACSAWRAGRSYRKRRSMRRSTAPRVAPCRRRRRRRRVGRKPSTRSSARSTWAGSTTPRAGSPASARRAAAQTRCASRWRSARIAIGRGDAAGALTELGAVERPALERTSPAKLAGAAGARLPARGRLRRGIEPRAGGRRGQPRPTRSRRRR